MRNETGEFGICTVQWVKTFRVQPDQPPRNGFMNFPAEETLHR